MRIQFRRSTTLRRNRHRAAHAAATRPSVVPVPIRATASLPGQRRSPERPQAPTRSVHEISGAPADPTVRPRAARQGRDRVARRPATQSRFVQILGRQSMIRHECRKQRYHPTDFARLRPQRCARRLRCIRPRPPRRRQPDAHRPAIRRSISPSRPTTSVVRVGAPDRSGTELIDDGASSTQSRMQSMRAFRSPTALRYRPIQ